MAIAAVMTMTSDVIVATLANQEAAIYKANWLAPEALLFQSKLGNGGNGNEAGKGGRSRMRDERDNKRANDEHEEILQKCCQSQERWHITENCLSQQLNKP